MAISVNYEELDGYPRSTWESGDFDAERRVLVAWSDRVQFLVELDTYPNNLYPYSDGPAEAIVRRAKIVPFDAPGEPQDVLATYQWAIIQIIHSTRGPEYLPGLNIQVRERYFPAYSYQTVSRAGHHWQPDGKPVQANDEPRRENVLSEYHCELINLLSLPGWVLTRKGVINTMPVQPLILGTPPFAPYTLKYEGCTIEGKWSLGKLRRYDVLARYTHNPNLWNHFWRPDGGDDGTGGFEKQTNKKGNEYIQEPLEPNFNLS